MKSSIVAASAAAAILLLGCLVTPGTWGLEDGGGAEGGREDGPLADAAAATDVGHRIDAGLSTDRGFFCPYGTQCNGSVIGCECCGSIGPSAICLCTNPCNDDDDCRQPGLAWCNKPDPASPGICTAQGFNCCWQCQ
jgi:hypothetical protein